MQKLLSSAIWLIRIARGVTPEQWAQVMTTVTNVEEVMTGPNRGEEKRRTVMDVLKGLFTSKSTLSLFVELAVAVLNSK